MRSSPRAPERVWPWLILLIAAIAAAYGSSLRAPFIFDDAGAVVNNETIRHLGSLDVFRPPADGSTTTGRPLVNATFALNYAVSGPAPWSYHVVNVAIHMASTLALFGLVRRLLARREPTQGAETCATHLALAVAALWALHPLQTESVVCIAQRTELLCGLWYLLTLYAFVRAVQETLHPRWWLALSVIACALGMASKEVMATAPLLVLLVDRTFVAGSFLRAWQVRRGYYLALGATWIVLAGLVLGAHGARGASAGFGLGVSPWHYLLTQTDAVIRYLGLSLWPSGLVLDYGTAVVSSPSDVAWQAGIVGLLVVLAGWTIVRRPRLGFVAAVFFLILAPSSSVIPLVGQTIAEHRMYLPLAGLVGAAIVMADRFFAKHLRWLTVVGAAALALVTSARVEVYRDEISVWRSNVARFPRGARGHNNLAQALQRRGAAAEADAEFARAVALDPAYVTAHYDWGVTLLERGRLAEAIEQLREAVRLAPDHADAHLNLGSALLETGQVASAVSHFEAALRLAPAADAHFDLGIACVRLGHDLEAAEHFRAALALNPQLSVAKEQFAAAIARMNAAAVTQARRGELDAAAAQFRRIIGVQPDDADAHANLGNVLALQMRLPEAIVEFQTAVRLRPEDPRLHEVLRQLQQARP